MKCQLNSSLASATHIQNTTWIYQISMNFDRCQAHLLEFLKNCIFWAAVVTGTLSWLFLVFTNFGAFIQYLAECKVTNTGTSQHCRQSPNLFQKFQQAWLLQVNMAYELGILLKKWIISWIFLDIIYLPMYYVLDLEVQNRIFLSRSYSQYPAWILQLKSFLQ